MLYFNLKAQTYWIRLCQSVSTSGYTLTCLLSMLWYHVTVLQQTDQRAAPAPTGTLFSDVHSHGSITSYITFWFGLEARFQLTGTCDRALTVLTHIFPSSRDPSLPPSFSSSHHIPPLAQTPLCPFTPFRKAVKQAVRSRLGWIRPFCDVPRHAARQNERHTWGIAGGWAVAFSETNDISVQGWSWKLFDFVWYSSQIECYVLLLSTNCFALTCFPLTAIM